MSEAEPQQGAAGDDTDPAAIEAFIGRWENSGGSELANFQPFAMELCTLLGLPEPEPSQGLVPDNDYVFERRVDFKHDDGSKSPGRIDLYKRDCFVMEGKQSTKRIEAKQTDPSQQELRLEDGTQVKAGAATRGTRRWDRVMRAAKGQAENYARALPREHGWPPFILVVDVGHVIEVYADFSGQGKNYSQFPDREGYSIPLSGLRDPAIRDRLRAIWSDPHSLDPAKHSAQVTRDIAERLARIALNLEGKHHPKEVAEFLMRCLFTMFAEDVGLLPEKGFEKLLGQMVRTPQHFVPAVESLWQAMDEGNYSPFLNATLKRFNGSLFRNRKAVALEKDDIQELYIAAGRDWRDVEPAIFGTLLERALDKRERSKLGAHFTPRAYVERLVVPTIIEPLRADWEEALTRAHELEAKDKHDAALKTIKDFHQRLCTARVLDPACGTGNFLYVSLELMKRLEGEVLDALDELGEPELGPRLAMEGETVSPRQFYGLELNPRAVAIADLVLWIGYLKWQLRTVKAHQIAEPVLHAYGTIKEQDAILAWNKRELLRDERGVLLSRWDGFSTAIHPITGEEIPDENATVELYRYRNPRPADWPSADFIVGNPPFIGKGEDMRTNLGDGYVDAIYAAYSDVPASADFVLYWWHRCALLLQRGDIVRFGLITTNSISQIFNRKILESKLYRSPKISVVWAVPDHPWVTAAGSAAVRIAMTVCEKGERPGALITSIREEKQEDGEYVVEFITTRGKISPRLKIGVDLSCQSLVAGELLASMGPALGSRGFVLSGNARDTLVSKDGVHTKKMYRKLLGPNELSGPWRGRYVADLDEISSESELATVAPSLSAHLRDSVYESRKHNKDKKLVRYWWKFRRSNRIWRSFHANISKLILTPETCKHRYFVFWPSEYMAEHGSITIAVEKPSIHAILSSRAHCLWAYENGGRLGQGPRYNKTVCFDNYPMPILRKDKEDELEALSDTLATVRMKSISGNGNISLTDLYNLVEIERVYINSKDVGILSEESREYHRRRMVRDVRGIHDELDRAVFEAYGWTDLIPAVVGKPGATTPSLHKTPEQEEAEEELLARLVALNQERATEEQRGVVRWLRPDYQISMLGHKVRNPGEVKQVEADLVVSEPTAGKPAWPKDELERIRIVRDMLGHAPSPMTPDALSAAFRGRNSDQRKRRVEKVLQTLVAAGVAQQGFDGQDGGSRYFIPR